MNEKSIITESNINLPQSFDKSCMKFLQSSDLPNEIYSISEIIGLEKALKFYEKAQGKKIYIPKKFKTSLAILKYLDGQSARRLIENMPGMRIDFRKKTTGVSRAFKACKLRQLKQEYLRRWRLFNQEFIREHNLSKRGGIAVLPKEREILPLFPLNLLSITDES